MLVEEAMNRNVRTIKCGATIQAAAKIMTEYRIGSLIVVDEYGKVDGIITERDILNKVVTSEYSASNVLVKDVMTKKIITISSKATLEDAAHLMVEKNIKKLPVVDDGELVGILTASDIIAFEKILIEKVAKLFVSRSASYVGG